MYRASTEYTSGLGIVTSRSASGFIAKLVNPFFGRWTMQPLKCVFNRRTMKPLEYLLQAGLELQFKGD